MGILDVPAISYPLGGAPSLRAQRKVGYLGDSITHGSNAGAGRRWVDQLPKILGTANISADSFIEAGVPGDTSTGMLARYETDIREKGVKFLYLLAGTNDVNQAVPLTTYAANMDALYRNALRDGIQLIVGTIPPMGANNATPAKRLAIEQFNLWLTVWASYNNIPLAQVWSGLAAANGGVDYLGGYDSGDGIHPNTLGHQQIALAFAAVSKNLFPTRFPVMYAAGYGNLAADPLALSGGTKPSGWFEQPGGTGTAPTYSIVADATGRLLRGKWAMMDFDATVSGGTRYYVCPITGGWTVGDTLAFFAKLQITDVAGNLLSNLQGDNPQANISLRVATDGFVLSPLLSNPSVVQPGDMLRAYTIPAGTTGLDLVLHMTLPTGCHVQASIGEPGVYDATQLGLVAML